MWRKAVQVVTMERGACCLGGEWKSTDLDCEKARTCCTARRGKNNPNYIQSEFTIFRHGSSNIVLMVNQDMNAKTSKGSKHSKYSGNVSTISFDLS